MRSVASSNSSKQYNCCSVVFSNSSSQYLIGCYGIAIGVGDGGEGETNGANSCLGVSPCNRARNTSHRSGRLRFRCSHCPAGAIITTATTAATTSSTINTTAFRHPPLLDRDCSATSVLFSQGLVDILFPPFVPYPCYIYHFPHKKTW